MAQEKLISSSSIIKSIHKHSKKHTKNAQAKLDAFFLKLPSLNIEKIGANIDRLSEYMFSGKIDVSQLNLDSLYINLIAIIANLEKVENKSKSARLLTNLISAIHHHKNEKPSFLSRYEQYKENNQVTAKLAELSVRVKTILWYAYGALSLILYSKSGCRRKNRYDLPTELYIFFNDLKSSLSYLDSDQRYYNHSFHNFYRKHQQEIIKIYRQHVEAQKNKSHRKTSTSRKPSKPSSSSNQSHTKSKKSYTFSSSSHHSSATKSSEEKKQPTKAGNLPSKKPEISISKLSHIVPSIGNIEEYQDPILIEDENDTIANNKNSFFSAENSHTKIIENMVEHIDPDVTEEDNLKFN